MVAVDYTVRLEAFEGPLDLLLFLIRRAEVDIHDIPIAAITEQYLKFVERLMAVDAPPPSSLRLDTSPAGSGGGGLKGNSRRLDIEQAGEFLVMAATLMEIKSRMLGGLGKTANDDAKGEGEPKQAETDPRAELVRQLLEYKRYRDATDRLEEWKNEWEHRYPTAKAVVGKPSAEELAAEIAGENAAEEARVDVDDLTIIDLVEAFSQIVARVDFSRVGEHRVVVDDTPVEVHGDRIVERLRGGGEGGNGTIRFRSLFEKRTRSEMIGIFLAILELVKQQRVLVEQEHAGESGDDGPRDAVAGEIVLKLGPAGMVGGLVEANVPVTETTPAAE